MSEATPEVGTPATPAEPAPTPDPETPAQEPDWKAMARKHEERAKANKSALDELTAKYEALEAQHGELSTKFQTIEQEKERNALISEVAAAKGVPASALRGSTREELEAHADTLAELIKPSGPVIPGQEQAPNKVTDDPLRSFTRNLFANSND